jgi:hypothetical protein
MVPPSRWPLRRAKAGHKPRQRDTLEEHACRLHHGNQDRDVRALLRPMCRAVARWGLLANDIQVTSEREQA